MSVLTRQQRRTRAREDAARPWMGDVILARGCHIPNGATDQDRRTLQAFRDTLVRAEGIIADNVLESWPEKDDHGARPDVRTLQVTPPFEFTWMEAWLRNREVLNHDDSYEIDALFATGALMHCQDLGPAHPSGDRWEVGVVFVGYRPNVRDLPNVQGFARYRLDANGVMSNKYQWLQLEAHRPSYDSRGPMLHSAIAPYFYACALANCTNVRFTPHPRRVPVNTHRPGRLPRDTPPILRYSMLVLDGPKERIGQEIDGPGEQHERALHLCRGHFARYSEDRPLFGRITGLVWRRAHLRGTADAGAVVKQYTITDA